jgi:hypothetical protein
LRTAQSSSELSGSAEITHPFHPLRGQRFEILKTRRLSGVETLILRGTVGGTFAVARAWTDRAEPTPYASLERAPLLVTVEGLLALRELLESLEHRSAKGVDK